MIDSYLCQLLHIISIGQPVNLYDHFSYS
jgi:hypothetical protein